MYKSAVQQLPQTPAPAVIIILNKHYLTVMCVRLSWEHKAPASITAPSMLMSLLLALENTHKRQ